jgi:hypothetical protein
MRIELQDIPGLTDEFQTVHRIRSLSLNGKNAARVALLKWKRDCPADWKKLMKAIRYVGTNERRQITNPKYVKKCDNPAYGDVYEFRADKGKPRLFFFYNPYDATVVVCTNDHEKDDSRKGKTGGQDAAFRLCADMKRIYEGSMKQ